MSTIKFTHRCTVELFDTLVLPKGTGVKFWGHEGSDILETLHLKFCKIVLSLTKNTPTCNCMIYGELGRTPIGCKIKVKISSFWFKLVKKTPHKLRNMVYNLIYNMHISGFYDNSWLIFFQKLLMIVVFHIIWNDQNINISVSVLKT